MPDSDFNGTIDLQVDADSNANLAGHYEFENVGNLGEDTSPIGSNHGTAIALAWFRVFSKEHKLIYQQ